MNDFRLASITASSYTLAICVCRAKLSDACAGQSKSSVHFEEVSTSGDKVQEECSKIWTGLEVLFHVLFVFVTDNLVQTSASADVVVVDADSLDTFVSAVMRRATSTHCRKKHRSV